MQIPGEEPRRIVKKIVKHGGHHGGAWKVAYADFVTAMMALFIVLWIVGQSKSVKEAVAAYFKDPTVFQSGAATILKGGSGTTAPSRPAPPAPPAPPARSEGGGSGERDRAALEATAGVLKKLIHKETQLTTLEDKIKIELAEEGLRIQLVESAQGIFFDVGSARIKPATHQLLGLIAHEVGKLPNRVALEGHTDSRPYTGQPSYSNWELSADRANAARRILDGSGLRSEQVASVVGYADRRLANPKDAMDAANRRISIIVQYQKGAAAPESPLPTGNGPPAGPRRRS
jgi:chemotaxis protein MotB